MSDPSSRWGGRRWWPVAADRSAATGRVSARGLDRLEDEVVVRPGEGGLPHLVGVVAGVGEVLVHRDVPAIGRDRPVEVGERLLLCVAGGTEGPAERGLDLRLLGALGVHEAAV